jgi:Domain of unknown function (DUF4838)/Glycosyl hydrolase family 67 N-terminus
MVPRIAIRACVSVQALLLGSVVVGAAVAADKAAADSTLVLAENGKTEFCIIGSEHPSATEQLARAELQQYLSLLCGAEFPLGARSNRHSIVVCRRDSCPAGIVLPLAASTLPPEGYCITLSRGDLVLAGADDRGVLYAVYDLLQRLGCRWLAPGFDFYGGSHEAVPKSQKLELSLPEPVIEQPGLKYRKLYVEEGLSHNTANLRQLVEWMPKRRFNTLVVPLNYAGRGRVLWDNWRKELTPELRRRGIWIEVGGHGYENFIRADMEGGQLFQNHAEWFGMNAKGDRVPNAHTVFCTANAGARKYFIAHVEDYLSARPEIQIFDFWPPDGARWCQCTNCAALGSPSDRQARLLAEVSAAIKPHRPDLRFETIAYAACVAPPRQVGLDPAVLIDFCPIGQCFEVQMEDPASDKNAEYVRQLKGWLASFHGDLSIYSYYRKYAWHSLPNLIPHYIQNDLRFYRRAGVHGISSYSEPGDWGTYELNHYVLGALAWNPDAHVDAIVSEFAAARFGAQEKLARRAFTVLEGTVRHVCNIPGTSLKSTAECRQAAEAIGALGDEIERARKSSAGEPAAKALNRLRLALEYARKDCLLQAARAEGADAVRMKALTAELGAFLREHAAEGVFIVSRIPAARPPGT